MSFWNHISFCGEFAIAALSLSISFDILFLSSRIVSGVFLWRDCAIFLWSWILAKTGMSDIFSIFLRLYSCRGDLILFIIIPWIGVFCSLATFAALSVVWSVTWSGDVTRNILSAAAMTGFSSP